MTGVLELKRYKYTDVILPKSNVKVSGRVNVVDGKIYSTEERINCKWEDKSFSFTLNQQTVEPMFREEVPDKWNEPTVSTSSWPSGLSVDETIAEFKAFVLADIV